MGQPGSWQRAAHRSEIVAGEALGVTVAGTPIVLVELDGVPHALGDICPHAYALLSQGYLEGREIECPLHAARFDIATGRCLEGPTAESLTVYEVEVRGEDVYVRMP